MVYVYSASACRCWLANLNREWLLFSGSMGGSALPVWGNHVRRSHHWWLGQAFVSHLPWSLYAKRNGQSPFHWVFIFPERKRFVLVVRMGNYRNVSQF
jgi:hypothetical protein